MSNILIVEDEKNIREGLIQALEGEGYYVVGAQNGLEALKTIKSTEIDMVITDLRMPVMGGEELLDKIHKHWATIPVVILTGHGTVENAVQAMRKGAYDFVTKPVHLDRLFELVKRALFNRMVILRNRSLTQEIQKLRGFDNIVGSSPSILRILEIVKQVANTNVSVLITGESGVGKEVVADIIHEYSDRKNDPLVKVHCAALSETLLESELFGHEKGAFTGAILTRKGRFELANNGTIFLDEIGEINQNIQIKILRVLQEKNFERVGGEETINVDVRIIAATNRDLNAAISRGTFREDLYYRLNVVNIHVPPLRERAGDIPKLSQYFLSKIANQIKPHIQSISAEAQNIIKAYNWPGNIRELRNCIESAVVMCQDNTIKPVDLPYRIRNTSMQENKGSTLSIPIGIDLENAEKRIIENTLKHYRGNKSKTSEVLGIQRMTLYEKIKKYGIVYSPKSH